MKPKAPKPPSIRKAAAGAGIDAGLEIVLKSVNRISKLVSLACGLPSGRNAVKPFTLNPCSPKFCSMNMSAKLEEFTPEQAEAVANGTANGTDSEKKAGLVEIDK